METVKVRFTLLQEMLGTRPANPELFSGHILRKWSECKRASVSDEERAVMMAEEVAAVAEADPDATVDFAATIFPVANGGPIVWDYQVKGFFKEALMALMTTEEWTKEELKADQLSAYTYRRTVDNLWFVGPRVIPITLTGDTYFIGRPLRAQTMRGERICLARSEAVPEGSTFECEVKLLNPKRHRKWLTRALDYGALKGFLQWRNAGMGKFSYEIISNA
jgi:hypothetical protein